MSDETPCPRCRSRGKDWNGDDPKCAFLKGVFCAKNWNCATMNALRDLVGYQEDERAGVKLWNNDQSAGLLAVDNTFIVLCWYKNRGCTMQAVVIDGYETMPLVLSAAEVAIAQNEKASAERAARKAASSQAPGEGSRP